MYDYISIEGTNEHGVDGREIDEREANKRYQLALDLVGELKAFEPFNEQEVSDRRVIVGALESALSRGDQALANLFGREDPWHFTASAWVVSPDRSKVLMAYHNVYRSWSWLGGHADGDLDLRRVSLREVREESGLSRVRLASPRILSVEVLGVDGHQKRGAYVSSHLHLNLTYLVEADPADDIRAKPDENSAVGWLTPQEALARSSEPWFCERVYTKLIAKEQQRR